MILLGRTINLHILVNNKFKKERLLMLVFLKRIRLRNLVGKN
ncbi:hypothetical protein GPLA_0218 [Paraglaciecola polaris LMG 21857]|uniref:Uncharacterized protein n=1 Tax=Paraglaciecola polaris LMG 21857 TaxID=1129793 RepID=K6ZLC5_9ALTE|nr:hypothetical protein GPLA_0218 [Paraglaciecola polaris LMG 21857]